MTPISHAQVGGGFSELGGRLTPLSLYDTAQRIANAGDLDGDGVQDVIVGDRHSSLSGLQGAGAVFVYSGATGNLIYQILGNRAQQSFGSDVTGMGDVDGDGIDDFLVGVRAAKVNGQEFTGSVLLFSGATGTLIYRVDGPTSEVLFGEVVASGLDIDQDGIQDFMVSNGGVVYAAIYVYSGATGNLLLLIPPPGGHDGFGSTLAGIGDWNSDGVDDIAVGAPRAENLYQEENAGAIVIYSGSDGAILFRLDGPNGSGRLGTYLANAGDLNQDGIDDLLVGAPGIGTGYFSGTVYVYSGSDQSIIHQIDGESDFAALGPVANVGDLDKDGIPDFVTGAPGTSAEGLATNGSVLFFSGADATLLHRENGKTRLGGFGSTVTGIGDLDANGFPDALVSSFPEDRWAANHYEIFGFSPYLTSSSNTLSVSAGGTIQYQLSFPADAALLDYRILVSASGTGPTRFGVDIPLTVDSLARRTAQGIYPLGFTAGFSGTLNANGDATATATVPAGALSTLIGTNLYFAAVANRPGRMPEFSSVAAVLEITP